MQQAGTRQGAHRRAPARHLPAGRLALCRSLHTGCCASKPGKPVLELCLAHLPNRGDARWKLSDKGAIKNLVQIGVK